MDLYAKKLAAFVKENPEPAPFAVRGGDKAASVDFFGVVGPPCSPKD